MDAPEISVVVLAYRSAATITNFVDSLIDSLEKENLMWELFWWEITLRERKTRLPR